jgi:sensor histidine kinase YesM
MKAFIFSKQILPRLARHLAFWCFYFAVSCLIALPEFWRWGAINRGMLATIFGDALSFLPIYLLGVYSTLYLILPIYLRKRKLSLLFAYAFVLLAISIPAGYYVTEKNYMSRGYDSDVLDIFATALHNCMGNLITIAGAALIVKIMKDYWLRQRENELLAIENIRNKLHLLKMQMHPRILFVSLQRIYLAMDESTGEAPEMILKLSDLLSYLLYESESDQVPLSKEVQMIENYLALKKLEYKQEIDIQLATSGSLEGHWITPGLFLPLLEIGLERRAGAKRQTTVTVQLRAIGPKIFFTVTNDTPGKALAGDPIAQTTLRTVRERLRSATFQQSKLDLQSTAERLTILMQLERSRSRGPGHLAKTAKI